MTQDSGGPANRDYALRVVNNSYDWYRIAAVRSRRNYRISEVATIVISALIPVSATLAPSDAAVPAVLGSLVVIITGLRSLFHWQENYLRFSAAREAVEAQRRRYHTGAEPYDDPRTRDSLLAENVTRIEQEEMGGWIRVVSSRRPAGEPNPTKPVPDRRRRRDTA